MNTGYLTNGFTNQITSENSRTVGKTSTNVTTFMSQHVPGFITGKKDPFSDKDWKSFVDALSKYKPEKVTAIYQEIADVQNAAD